MKNIHIENSYSVWDWIDMRAIIENACLQKYNSYNPKITLHRSYGSMYVEWWLHNIGYYITIPFCNVEAIKNINLRCKDVDLEEHCFKEC